MWKRLIKNCVFYVFYIFEKRVLVVKMFVFFELMLVEEIFLKLLYVGKFVGVFGILVNDLLSSRFILWVVWNLMW